jgi:hypothetical protein
VEFRTYEVLQAKSVESRTYQGMKEVSP